MSLFSIVLTPNSTQTIIQSLQKKYAPSFFKPHLSRSPYLQYPKLPIDPLGIESFQCRIMRVSINQVQWSPCSFIFYLLKMSEQRQTTPSHPLMNSQESTKNENEVQILSSGHFLTLRIKEDAPSSLTLDDPIPDCPQLVKKNRSMNEKEDREISRYLGFDIDHRDFPESSITLEDRSLDQEYDVTQRADRLEISENSNQQNEHPQREENRANLQEMEVETTENTLCSDYTKNLPAYIIKKAIRLLFSPKSQTRVAKTCQRWGINHQDFRNHYLSVLPRLYGPNSIIHLFKPDREQDPTMKKMFAQLIFQILRGRYMIAVLQEGKMKDLETYIELKNKYLLYFDKLIRK